MYEYTYTIKVKILTHQGLTPKCTLLYYKPCGIACLEYLSHHHVILSQVEIILNGK